MGSPFNISAIAEASEFIFGMQLGFANPHHKITPTRKSGRGPGLGELPKFGTQLGFAKAHQKITPRGKSGRCLS